MSLTFLYKKPETKFLLGKGFRLNNRKPTLFTYKNETILIEEAEKKSKYTQNVKAKTVTRVT